MARRADPTRGEELVLVPEWSVGEEPAYVLVRPMSLEARATLMRRVMLFDEYGLVGFDMDTCFPYVVVHTAYDADDGTRLFTADQEDLVEGLNGSAVSRLAQAGLSVSGISNEQQKGFAKSFWMDPELRFEFELARDLGMTVGELRQKMDSREFAGWQMFHTVRNEQAAQRRGG